MFNGSRLGKAFSANVFNELFNNPDADRERLIPQPEYNRPVRRGKQKRKKGKKVWNTGSKKIKIRMNPPAA